MRASERAGLTIALLAAPACCVCAATPVQTPRGPRRLGDVAVGDVVWSIEVGTGARVERRVVARRAARRECVRLRHGAGELVCTPDHPLYSPESRSYEPASRWVEGARRLLALATDEGVAAVEVEAVEAYAGVREVVDLTVEGEPHNFVAGGVVVHNKEFDTSVSGFIMGPEFELTPEMPVRRFEIRTCVRGLDPVADESGMQVVVEATSAPAATAGALWYAVYFEGGGEVPFLDRRPGQRAVLDMITLAGMCAQPRAIVFERLDGLADGAIHVTWELEAGSSPPPGTMVDDTLDIEVTE